MACVSSQHGDWILRCGFQMEAFKEWAPRWWWKLQGLNGLVSELTQHHFYLVVRAVTRPPRFKLSGHRPYFSVKNDNKRAPIWREKMTKLHRHSMNTWKLLLSRCSMWNQQMSVISIQFLLLIDSLVYFHQTLIQFHLSVSSVMQSCLTLCDPMDCSMPGLPVHHQLPEPAQIHVYPVGDAIQPSHPLSSPSPPTFKLSQHQGLFKWVSSSHQVAKVLEFQLQHQSFQGIFRTDFL